MAAEVSSKEPLAFSHAESSPDPAMRGASSRMVMDPPSATRLTRLGSLTETYQFRKSKSKDNSKLTSSRETICTLTVLKHRLAPNVMGHLGPYETPLHPARNLFVHVLPYLIHGVYSTYDGRRWRLRPSSDPEKIRMSRWRNTKVN